MNPEPDVISALVSLRPDGAFTLPDSSDLSTLKWDPKTTPPTEKQIKAELRRLRKEWKAAEYARLRRAAYPSVGDQLDALFKAGAFPEEMAEEIRAVKEQFPKP